MSSENKYSLFLTFDCDPANFDPTLKVLGHPGFLHLEKSIPIAIDLLEQASENLGVDIKATFFIRNISTDPNGSIKPEPWKKHTDLWAKLISKGHGLGLHPHIDVPITSEEDPNFLSLTELMNCDFESLSQLQEFGRVTRVGGHAYNKLTTTMLKNARVQIDSSAIPGRNLGRYDDCSNWLEVDNKLKLDWTYPNLELHDTRPENRLAQLPMTTLRKVDHSGYRRYIDFSFAGLDEFSLTDFTLGKQGRDLVAISHPSSLLQNYYMEHPTLKFGAHTWMSNFMGFTSRFERTCGEVNFQILRNFT